MSNTYVKPADRKTILFIGDDLRAPSGVGVMSRAIVYRTAEHFNWVQIGVLTQHKTELMQPIDISNDINQEMGYKDANVVILPDVTYDGMYSCMENLRAAIYRYRPAAILFFTDPRYYEWLFNNEMEIRSYCPLIYLNIWDNLPYPIWNRGFYDACDGLFAISKQTFNINIQVLGGRANNKIIEYIPHGIENTYYPIQKNNPVLDNFKKMLFGDNSPEFTLLFNARNMGRKNVSDLILAWKMFTDTLDDATSRKCCLLMHCIANDWNGTDLEAVYKNNCNDKRCIVRFIPTSLNFNDMNLLYNCCDGVVLPSYAEGWGLSITESMMTGKMFIATVTGGMQDQMRFTDEYGQWINFSQSFPTNSNGRYKDHGEWCIPVFPSVARTAGSPRTPYIYEDMIRIQDLADSIKQLYDLGVDERTRRGMLGYEWANSNEAGFTAQAMAERVVFGIEETINLHHSTNHPTYRINEVVDDESYKINENIIWKKIK